MAQPNWEPRLPLTPLERFVDYPGHNTHIVNQRRRLERIATPITKRIALSVSDFGLPTYRQSEQLEQILFDGLERTVRFGYREAQREIRAQRTVPERKSLLPVVRVAPGLAGSSTTPATGALGDQADRRFRSETVLAQYLIPDAGKRSRIARAGLPGIRTLVRQRAWEVANHVSSAAAAAYAASQGKDKVTVALAVSTAASRSLHNHVLELVGEALNLGRSAGALESSPVPEFALRSEQLDNHTCEECDSEHGEIYQVGSPDYFDHLPPSYCLGGGRCRGLMVFGD